MQEGDVAVGGDPSAAGVVEQSGESLAGIDGADEDAFCSGQLADGCCAFGGRDGILLADEALVDVRDLAASPVGGDRGSGHRLDFDGMDFRTALNLVAAGLGVALLPRLLLLDAPPSVVVLPVRQPTLVRRLYTCRLDTRGVTASVRRLEMYLREAVAEL